MTISAIFVAYRTPLSMLQESILSLLTAAEKAQIELQIIVVDNGGAAAYATALPEVTLVGAGKNLGFGHAVNDAVAVAQGEQVLLMNPDSTADENLFVEFLEAKKSAPEGAMFGALLIKGGRPQVHAYNLWWGSLQLLVRKKRWASQIDSIVSSGSPATVTRLCGAGLFASREDLRALGPFDESFFLYGEDVDLSLRAKVAGHALLLVPRAVIDHDAGTSSEGSSRLVERARIDGHLRLLSIHRGYFRALLGRLEVAVSTLLGAALTRSTVARQSRLARLQEVRRWGVRRSAPRFDPASSSAS